MLKKSILILLASGALAACASSQPRVVQPTSNMSEVSLTTGLATQIELPDNGHVRSVVVGNPSLLTVEKADNVVNLIPKESEGQTNLIIRATDNDGDAHVYQYRVTVHQP